MTNPFKEKDGTYAYANVKLQDILDDVTVDYLIQVRDKMLAMSAYIKLEDIFTLETITDDSKVPLSKPNTFATWKELKETYTDIKPVRQGMTVQEVIDNPENYLDLAIPCQTPPHVIAAMDHDVNNYIYSSKPLLTHPAIIQKVIDMDYRLLAHIPHLIPDCFAKQVIAKAKDGWESMRWTTDAMYDMHVLLYES